MKLLYIAFASSLVSSMAYADFGSWTRNTDEISKPGPSTQELKDKKNLEVNVDVVDKTSTTSNNQSQQLENQNDKAIKNTNSSPIEKPYQAPYQAPNQTRQYTQNQALSDVDQRVINYSIASMSFVGGAEYQRLNPMESIALMKLNGALVVIGSDILSGSINQQARQELRNAVGCINSQKSTTLNTYAQQVIAKHSKYVSIYSEVNLAPQIGSNFTASCR